MKFTYYAYERLIEQIFKKGYTVCSYEEVENIDRAVILRHDVDFSLEKALKMAALESRLGVKSTYFVLLVSDFYNLHSKTAYEILEGIKSFGHEIGLHFDEKRYSVDSVTDFQKNIEREAEILSNILGKSVRTFSMHRPSRLLLESNVSIGGYINSYSSYFFNTMKYLSDSRMCWREDIMEAINAGEHRKLHILTHPFWYGLKEERMEYKLRRFIESSKTERYMHMDDNFRDLGEIIKAGEV